MSSKAIAAATQHFVQFEIQYASIALIYWDYALTIRDEVEYMWFSKGWFKLSKLLYILCRYSLLANVLYVLAISGVLGSNCDTWYKGLGVISVLGRAAILTAFTMRAYAVWSQNKLVLVGLGSMALTCVILDGLHLPGLQCSGSTSTPLYNKLLSILVCVFEFTATVLTTVRCIQAMKVQESIRSQKNTLWYIIVEEGKGIILQVFTRIAQPVERYLTMQTWSRNHYYSVVSCFTIAAVVLNFHAPNNFFQRLLNALTLPLSGIFTARFLLHLRAADANRTASLIDRSNARIGIGEDIVFRRESSTLATFSSAVVDGFGEDPISSAFNRSKAASNAPANDDWDNMHARTSDEESVIGFAREEYKNKTATGKRDSCSSFEHDFHNVEWSDVDDPVFVVYTNSIEAMALS